mgnify:CR=1 FL=1
MLGTLLTYKFCQRISIIIKKYLTNLYNKFVYFTFTENY